MMVVKGWTASLQNSDAEVLTPGPQNVTVFRDWVFQEVTEVLGRSLGWVLGFPDDSDSKESTCNAGDPVRSSWVRKIPWRRAWQPTPITLPREFHGQRSLVSYIQSMGSQRAGHDWMTKHILRVGTNPIWLVSLWEEETWTQKEVPGMHAQKGKTM